MTDKKIYTSGNGGAVYQRPDGTVYSVNPGQTAGTSTVVNYTPSSGGTNPNSGLPQTNTVVQTPAGGLTVAQASAIAAAAARAAAAKNQ